MTKVMIGFGIVAYGVGVLLGADFLPWTVGVLLGLVIALLKMRVMETTLTKAVSMPEDKAKNYTQRHYMLRYLLTGLVLFVAALSPTISLLGVFVGLLSMKVGAYAQLYKKQ